MAVLANFANVLKTRAVAVHGPLGFLTTNHHDILMFVWGWGALAKAKGGAKRKSLSRK